MNSSHPDTSQHDPQAESHPNDQQVLEHPEPTAGKSLPQIPAPDLDLSLSLESIINSGDPGTEKVQKRASNVMKLAQENEKLQAELKAMTDRIEAAERRRQELERKGGA